MQSIGELIVGGDCEHCQGEGCVDEAHVALIEHMRELILARGGPYAESLAVAPRTEHGRKIAAHLYLHLISSRDLTRLG